MKMKLIFLLCWSMLLPMILQAQAPAITPGIGVYTEIYSTIGQSWDGDIQLYLSNASVGTTFGGSEIASGGRQFGPNDFSPHGVLYFQQQIIPNLPATGSLLTYEFPVSIKFKMDETIYQFITPMHAVKEEILGLTSTTPLSGSYYLFKGAAPGNFGNNGYIFNYNIGVPQVPAGRFGAYDNVNRTVGRTKFCHNETMYVDTWYNTTYNALAVRVNKARFIWEYIVDGTSARKTYISGSNTGAFSIPIGDIAMPDPTRPVTGHIRVAMLGPVYPIPPSSSSDGLLGPWSSYFDFTIYPEPPQVNITQTPAITDFASLTESNADASFVVKHVACNGGNNGGIIINKLNQTSGYLIAIKNLATSEVMNFTANWSPSPANPIKLPDDALSGKGIASGIFPFRAGTYEMKIQNINPDDPLHGPFACFSVQNFTIKQPTSLSVSNSKKDASCAVDFVTKQPSHDGQITVVPTGGIAPYDYTLTALNNPVTRTLTDQAGNGIFGALSPVTGTTPEDPQIEYQVTAKDDAGCPAPATPTLKLATPPRITVQTFDNGPALNDGFNIRCFGGKDNIEIDINGGADMFSAWLNGPTGTNYQLRNNINVPEDQLVFTDLVAGNYTAVAVDQNGCRAELPFTFTQPAKIEIESSTITPATCFDNNTGAITMNGKGGVAFAGDQYKYSLPTLPEQQGVAVTFIELTRGTYTMNIVDAHGCSQPYPVEVTSPPALAIGLDVSDVICFGTSTGSSTATLGGGTAPYTFDWLDGSKDVISTVPLSSAGVNTISDRNAGQYYARITDAHSCVKETVFVISQPAEPLDMSAGLGDVLDVSCNGLNDGKVTLTVNGGWLPYSIGQSPADLHPNAFLQEHLTPGVHTLYVKDLKGCTDSFDVTIEEPAPLEATADDLKGVSCFGDDDGAFTPNIKGGTAPYQIFDNTMGWIAPERVGGLTTGNYQLSVRDSRACTLVANILIPTPQKLEAALASTTDTRCGESNGGAHVNVTGGTLPYSAEWVLTGQVITRDVNPTTLPPGIYDVVIIDANHCQVPFRAGISTSDGPQIAIESTTPASCSDSADGTAITTANGGATPYVSITWSTGETGFEATALLKGPNFIAVEDQKGCIATKQVDIDGPEEIIGNFTATSPKCFGDTNGSLLVTASGGTAPYGYQWVDTSNKTNLISSIGGGDHSITITDAHGCIAVRSYDLSEPNPVVVDLTGESLLCTGQKAVLDAGNPGATYQWTATNGFTSTARVIEATSTGSYSVVVTDVNGCKGSDTFDLRVDSDILHADFIAASEAIVGDTVVLINITFPLPDSSYWDFPDGGTIVRTTYYTQEIVFDQAGEYAADLYATKGECLDHYQGKITIIEEVAEESNGDDDSGRKQELVRSFIIHPNPSDGRFVVSVELSEAESVSLDIVSMNAVSTQARYSGSGKDYYEIDVSLNVSPGMYSVVLFAGKEKLVKRIIIY